jgi:hypothetical protein
MKLNIKIEYNSGETATFTVQPPEWVKWEKDTGRSAGDWNEVAGIKDVMFLAYHVMKREAGGTPVKPYEAWLEGVSDFEVIRRDPKVITEEA